MKIILKEDTELLDEVVIVGYGTQKKASLTGAVATVDNDKAEEPPYCRYRSWTPRCGGGVNVTVPTGEIGSGSFN